MDQYKLSICFPRVRIGVECRVLCYRGGLIHQCSVLQLVGPFVCVCVWGGGR